MKKTLCAALAVVMALTLLPGCKKESGNLTADGKVKLLIGLPGGYGVTCQKVVENFIAATADKYEVTTDEAAWNDYTKKLQLQVASKQGVTPVFPTDSGQATAFGAKGVVADLSAWAESELDTELYSDALYAVSDKEGHLWGVPHALNSIAMIYNKDIFDERGVAYPTADWTWQDMLDMAEKLTFTRADGTKVYGIDYIHNITCGWLPFMSAVGVIPYKDDFQYSNMDDPKILEAMEKYVAPIRAGHVMPAAELQAIGGQGQAFALGQMAMVLCQASSITSINSFNPDLNYDAMIMPIGWNGERTCIYVPNVWQVSASSDEAVQNAAKDWLKFYLSEESQIILANEAPSGFPIMKSALDIVSNSGRKPANIKAFYEGIDDHGMTILENPASSVANTVINNMVGELKLDNTMDVAARVAAGHEELVRTLDDFYER